MAMSSRASNLLAALLLFPASLASAQSMLLAANAGGEAVVVGGVSGRVTDARQAPLASVSVVVEGTSLGAVTRDDGTYRIAGVPVGARTIVARRVGYTPQRRVVAIADNQDITADFQLEPAPTSLEGVVTTATGEQRRVELGNTVAAVDVTARLQSAPVKSIGDLINAQAPGVQVQIGTSTGAVSRVRIRGLSSMNLTNDPIYIIDGVRMTTTVGGAGTGASITTAATTGQSQPSRVNDLNPEEIESIEVVKGPSAATLYGTDAANGVIVITTKRGRAGAASWQAHAEQGVIDDRNDYPAQYGLLGKSPNSTTQRRCFTYEVGSGACVLDSAVTLDIWKDPDLTPLKAGGRTVAGASVSGGSRELRYFLSADTQREDGPFSIPTFDRRRFDSTGVTITPEMERPSHLEQKAFRANVNAVITPKLDIAVSSGLSLNELRFPQMDNNTDGFVYNAIAGPGYFVGPAYTGVGLIGEKLFGYAQMTPGSSFQKLSQQTVNRFIGSSSANWQPVAWLQTKADAGIDLSDRKDYILQRLGEGPTAGTARQGSAIDSRARISNITANLRATATWQATKSAQLRSTAGAQFVSFDLSQTTATGTQLAPGGEAPSQGAVYSVGSTSSPNKTLGGYIEEQAAIRDRLFLTVALRTDKNSAFGVNYGNAYYPKAAVSWILSDEPFFPKVSLLNQLRFRASLGSSGVQPPPTAALRTYGVGAVYFGGATTSGLTQSNPGNASLKPERSTELETGFDTQWWSDRVTLEVTYYAKRTKDALILNPVAPSAGVNSYFVNLGGVQNRGFEYRVQSQLIDGRNVGLDFVFSGSTNKNKVTALGNIITTPTSNIQVGKPIYAVFQRKITFTDPNNDGILTFPDVTISPATDVEYLGPRTAPTQVTLSAGLELLQRRLRVTALVDRKAGGRDQNIERQLPCLVADSCKEIHKLDAELWDQARGIALKQGVFAGYSENSNFTKLREVAATYDLGEAIARRISAKGARLSVGVRNVKTWTKWSGTDPEAFISNNQDSPAASQSVFTIAQPMYYMARLNLTF